MTLLPAIPEASELVRPDVVRALELEVRERVRAIDDLGALEDAAARMNALAKSLAGTQLAPYPTAAARRIEWQIGRLLGEPPGQGARTDLAGLPLPGGSDDDRYKFRLIGTLDLEWDALEPWTPSRSRLVKVAQERRRNGSSESPEIRHGDFRDVLADVEPSSVSLVITDPPYAACALPEYEGLGAFAAEKLMEGGSLVCYVGQSTLPGTLAALSEHLRYWWCLALEHRGGGQQMPGKWVRIKWKPVLWFVKGSRRDRVYVHDLVRGVKPDKPLHEWAQGVDEVLPLIESLTSPGELVCDPFAGSGSFGIAAHKIGRRFVGADDRV